MGTIVLTIENFIYTPFRGCCIYVPNKVRGLRGTTIAISKDNVERGSRGFILHQAIRWWLHIYTYGSI